MLAVLDTNVLVSGLPDMRTPRPLQLIGPAQESTRAFLTKRLKGVDSNKAKVAFDKVMSHTRPGRGPSTREIDAAIESH
jgi:hypothetical protein